MKKSIKKIFLILLLVLLFLTSCSMAIDAIKKKTGGEENKKEPEVLLDSLYWEKNNLDLQVGDLASLKLEARPVEKRSQAKITYSYNNELIKVIADSRGVMVEGLKQGKTILSAQNGNILTNCACKIEGFSDDYEREPYIYTTSSNNIIQLKPGTSERVVVSLYGGKVEDNQAFTWTVEKPGVAEILGNGQFCVITGKSEGNTKITVRHPKSTYDFTFLVYVLQDAENATYITTKTNVLTLKKDKGEKEIEVAMQNAPQGFNASLYDWKLETDESDPICSIDANSDKCVVTPLKSGTARIKVSHPSATYPLEILIRVVEIVENVYITASETNVVLEGDTSQSIKLELKGYNGVYDKNTFTVEVPATEVFTYAQYGNEINFKGKKNGIEKIIIRHELAKYPLEVLVKSTKQKYDAVDVSKYITTSQNYIRTKVGASPINLSIFFSGGDVGDNKSFKWTVIHNSKEQGQKVIDFKTTDGEVSNVRSISFKLEEGNGVITPLAEGSATITISHPKALYSTDVIVEVMPEWAVLEGECWITGENILTLLNGTEKDISVKLVGEDISEYEYADTVWENESTTIELIANELSAKVKAIGTEKSISEIYVKHPRVNTPKKITVLQANTQEELDSMKVLISDSEQYTVRVGETTSVYIETYGFSYDEMNNISWEVLDTEKASVTYDDNNRASATVKGLKVGSTKLLCKSNIAEVDNLVFDILVVPEDANIWYAENVVYLTTNENVIVLENPGNTEVINVDMKGKISNYEKQSIKWDNKNPDVIEIIPNGKTCKVKALKEGEALLRLSHESSKNSLNIYVYVGNKMQYKRDKTVYIKTNQDIITAIKGTKPIKLMASLENSETKSGFKFEIDNKNIAQLDYSSQDTYLVKPCEAGQATITITHPESKFTKNVLVVVGNTEAELLGFSYLSTANNVVTVIEGSKTNVSVTVMNSEDIVLDGYSWESDDRSICDIVQDTGATANIVGNSVGTTKLTVKNKLCEYPLEIIVNCVSAAFASSQPYIATPATVVLLKTGENIDWKQISATLEGGNDLDQQNFSWSVDDPSMVTAFGQGNRCNIKATKAGTTRLQITHPKANYPCYVLLICENVKDTKYIISLKNVSNLITMKPTDRELSVVVALVNGDAEDKYAFTWSLDNWDVVEMTSTGNTATIKPLKEGQATIKISHPKSNNDETIVVKVQEFSKFGFSAEYVKTSEGANYVIPLQVPVSNIKTHIECETLNDKVCTITNTNKIAQITGVGAGTTTVKAKLIATKTNTVQAEAEMMVIVEKAADQLTYLTTNRTVYILEKGTNKNISVNLQGEGINPNDIHNIEWKSSDPKVVKLIGASTTGIATGSMVALQAVAPGDAVITVSHEKVNTNLTIKINVPETSEMSISLNKTYLKIEKSGSNSQAELKATILNGQLSDYDTIEWTADKENGLDIVKIMGSGESVYIFPIEVNKKTKIRAKLPNGNEAVCDVEVVSGRQFNFKTKALTLNPGQSKTIDYVFEPRDGQLSFETDTSDYFSYEVDEDTQQITITGLKVGRGKILGISESGNATLSVKVDWDYGFTTNKSFIDKSPSEYEKNPNSDEFIIPYTVSPEFADVTAELQSTEGGQFARLSVDKGSIDPDNPNLRRGKIYVRIEREGKGTIHMKAQNPRDNDKVFGKQTCSLTSRETEVQIKLKDLKSDGNFSRIDTDAEGNSSLVISDGERVDFKIDSNVELKDVKVDFIQNELGKSENFSELTNNIVSFSINHPIDYVSKIYKITDRYYLYYKDDNNVDHLVRNLEYVDFSHPAEEIFDGGYYKLSFADGFDIFIDPASPYGYVRKPGKARTGGGAAEYDEYNPSYPELREGQKYYPTEILSRLRVEKGEPLIKPVYFTHDAFLNSVFFIRNVSAGLKKWVCNSWKKWSWRNSEHKWFFEHYRTLRFPQTEFIPLQKSDKKIFVSAEKEFVGFISVNFKRNGISETKKISVYFEKRPGCFKYDVPNGSETGDYIVETEKLTLY